jgi:hypothetical protein
MGTSYFYGRINDKWVPRVFMGEEIINEFLVLLRDDKW